MSLAVKLNPPSLAAAPDDMHAHIVIAAPGARLAFIAGQVAIDNGGHVVGPGDLGRQAEQCFHNVQLALEAIAASPADIVEMTIIVVDYSEPLLAIINRAGLAVFGQDWPRTATTLIGAQALGHSSFLIEVKATVVLAAQ